MVAEDVAAAEMVRRLDAAGHRPAVITVDLGPEVAVDLASGGLVRAVLARQPWEQGAAAATAAVLALLGHEVPPRIAVPALTVTRESVLEAFLEVWHEHPPAELAAARWGKRRN